MRENTTNAIYDVIEKFLLARVSRRYIDEMDWWSDWDIDDRKRDVHYRLDRALPDKEQAEGVKGYKLDTIIWSRVEYWAMEDRSSGGPPDIFFHLEPGDLIKIFTIPATCEQVMIQVAPPGLYVPGSSEGCIYHDCDVIKIEGDKGGE